MINLVLAVERSILRTSQITEREIERPPTFDLDKCSMKPFVSIWTLVMGLDQGFSHVRTKNNLKLLEQINRFYLEQETVHTITRLRGPDFMIKDPKKSMKSDQK